MLAKHRSNQMTCTPRHINYRYIVYNKLFGYAKQTSVVKRTHCGFLCYMTCAVAYKPDGLHAGVWEAGVAGELAEALDGVLERVDHGGQVLLEQRR